MAATEHPFTGLTASIKIGEHATAKTLGYVSGCDLTLEKDIIEVLSFGMQYKEKVPSIKDWSVSIDGTVALTTGSTQQDLYNAFDASTPITLGIYLDETTYFEGTGYVKNFNISASPDDKISLKSEIAGTGAVTLTIPTT
jgi:predicted secreted protein